MIITLDDEDMTEMAAMAGIVLDEGQAALLAAGMRKGSDGKWAQSRVTVPGSQGDVTRVRELAGMFLLRERVLHVSARHAQSADEARRMTEIVTGRPELSRQVSRISRAHGAELIRTHQGGEILFTAGSGRGCRADLAVLSGPGPDTEAAVLPCLAAGNNPQIWTTEGP